MIIEGIKKFSKLSNLKKSIFFYTIFNILFMFLMLFLVSLMSFLHFQLDHDMLTIESWLQEYGWELIIFSKVLVLFITLKTISIRKASDFDMIKFLKSRIQSPRYYIFVFILFIYFMGFSISDVIQSDRHIGFLSLFISFTGSIIFYLADLFVLTTILEEFPLEKEKDFFKLIAYSSMIFMIFTYITIPYSRNIILFLTVNFFTLLFLVDLKSLNLLNGFSFLLFLTAPLNTFFGSDLVWGKTKALFDLEFNTPAYFILFIWVLACGYIEFIRRKDFKNFV